MSDLLCQVFNNSIVSQSHAACLKSLYIWCDFIETVCHTECETLHQTHFMQIVLVNSM